MKHWIFAGVMLSVCGTVAEAQSVAQSISSLSDRVSRLETTGGGSASGSGMSSPLVNVSSATETGADARDGARIDVLNSKKGLGLQQEATTSGAALKFFRSGSQGLAAYLRKKRGGGGDQL